MNNDLILAIFGVQKYDAAVTGFLFPLFVLYLKVAAFSPIVRVVAISAVVYHNALMVIRNVTQIFISKLTEHQESHIEIQ